MRTKRDRAQRLGLDRDRFSEMERVAVYEMVNFLLIAQLDLQRVFGLRAEEFQVFHLVALATVQRYVRGAASGEGKLDRTPLGPEESGSISRRRIAETLGIPLETVRRQVRRLIDDGLLVERGRGRIATPGGTLARANAAGVTLNLANHQMALTNSLVRLGIFVRPGRSDARRGLT